MNIEVTSIFKTTKISYKYLSENNDT